MKLFAVLVCAVLAAAIPAVSQAAQGDFDGNALKTVCAARDEAAGQFCQGYLAGYLEGFRIAMTTGAQTQLYCFPRDLTLSALGDVVKAYLAAHPRDLGLPADLLIARALDRAYGCEPPPPEGMPD